MPYGRFHRLFAALAAISRLRSGESLADLARPPALPPLARFGAFPLGSSISPVAIRPTMAPISKGLVGRFSPLGPLAIAVLASWGLHYKPCTSWGRAVVKSVNIQTDALPNSLAKCAPVFNLRAGL